MDLNGSSQQEQQQEAPQAPTVSREEKRDAIMSMFMSAPQGYSQPQHMMGAQQGYPPQQMQGGYGMQGGPQMMSQPQPMPFSGQGMQMPQGMPMQQNMQMQPNMQQFQQQPPQQQTPQGSQFMQRQPLQMQGGASQQQGGVFGGGLGGQFGVSPPSQNLGLGRFPGGNGNMLPPQQGQSCRKGSRRSSHRSALMQQQPVHGGAMHQMQGQPHQLQGNGMQVQQQNFAASFKVKLRLFSPSPRLALLRPAAPHEYFFEGDSEMEEERLAPCSPPDSCSTPFSNQREGAVRERTPSSI